MALEVLTVLLQKVGERNPGDQMAGALGMPAAPPLQVEISIDGLLRQDTDMCLLKLLGSEAR